MYMYVSLYTCMCINNKCDPQWCQAINTHTYTLTHTYTYVYIHITVSLYLSVFLSLHINNVYTPVRLTRTRTWRVGYAWITSVKWKCLRMYAYLTVESRGTNVCTRACVHVYIYIREREREIFCVYASSYMWKM